MILSSDKIRQEIENGNVFVGENKERCIKLSELKFDTTSLELHLGNTFKIWKKPIPGEVISVDPSNTDFNFRQYALKFTEDGKTESDGSFILASKEFVLCQTSEYIRLPKHIAARVEGKSKLARLGIAIHLTAPTIHANWEGYITLEIYNHSPISIRLNPGLGISQLIFEEVTGDILNKENTFSQNQESALGRSEENGVAHK
jgi:dCTP deaminase